MELVLNSVWLLGAALTLAAWWIHRTRDTQSLSRALLALGFSFLLLFPVVSISDDLHVYELVMEDTGTSNRWVKSSASAKVQFSDTPAPYATRAEALSEPSWQVLGQIAITPAANVSSPPSPQTQGRAPPAFA